MSQITKILFLCCAMLPSQYAFSYESDSFYYNTAGLPKHCQVFAQYKLNPGNSHLQSQWRSYKKVLGKVAGHMNHYCTGVYGEFLAKTSTDRQRREAGLRNALGQMQYASPFCPSSCVLYPDLNTRIAWALIEYGRVEEGLNHYNMVIKNKPGYTPAYAKLSDFYIKNNLIEEAREILELGLKHKPDSRSLKRRLRKLDDSP